PLRSLQKAISAGRWPEEGAAWPTAFDPSRRSGFQNKQIAAAAIQHWIKNIPSAPGKWSRQRMTSGAPIAQAAVQTVSRTTRFKFGEASRGGSALQSATIRNSSSPLNTTTE